MWAIAYAALLAVLFVRVGPPQHRPVRPKPTDPLRLVAWHHRVFYALLVGAPVEALLVGGGRAGRVVGLVLFAAGVAGYRVAGQALGPALSPLVEPRDGAELVTSGPYRWVRHPMYLAQACIAVGAPLSLGSRVVVWLAVPAIAILLVRMGLEEQALARRFPAYRQYASRARCGVPFV